MLCSFPSLSPGTSSYTHTTTTHKTTKHNQLSYHPADLCIDIVGIIARDCGRSCDDYPFCGEVVALDIVALFWCEMIHVPGGTDGGPGKGGASRRGVLGD